MDFPDIFGKKEQKKDEKPEVKSEEIFVTLNFRRATVLTCGYFECLHNKQKDKSCNLKDVLVGENGQCASFQSKKQEP